MRQKCKILAVGDAQLGQLDFLSSTFGWKQGPLISPEDAWEKVFSTIPDTRIGKTGTAREAYRLPLEKRDWRSSQAVVIEKDTGPKQVSLTAIYFGNGIFSFLTKDIPL